VVLVVVDEMLEERWLPSSAEEDDVVRRPPLSSPGSA
jgi:hypothetical protein